MIPSRSGAVQPKRNRWWTDPRFWLGIVSSTIFLWLVLRQVSWPQVLTALQYADWKLISLGLLLMTATWALFAVRWQVLLAPTAAVQWSDSFSYILIGYLGNAVLPFRLGDISRIVFISKKHTISIVFTSATVVLERLLDVLTVVAFAGLLMIVVPLPELIRQGVQATALAALGAFVVLAMLSRSQGILTRLEPTIAGHLPGRIAESLFAIVQRFVQGLRVTTSLGQLLRIGLLSALSWGIAGLSILCFVNAFQLAVPWQAALLVLAVTNLGGAIPSSPGAIGVYEFLAVLALSVWLPERNAAVGFALVTHASNLALSVVLGLLAAWREGIRLSAIAAESQDYTEIQDRASGKDSTAQREKR